MLGRGHAFLRVLDADAEDLFAPAATSPRCTHADAEEAEPLGDERARLGREHLPFGRAEEDRERRRPRAEQRDDLGPLLAERGGFGLGDLREIDRARALPVATRSSSSRTCARMRMRNASRSYFSSTPS